MNINKKNGQSLVEVVIAVAISILIIGGLLAAVTMALRSAKFAQNQATATKYAQEGMEAVRSIRDSNWSSLNTNGNYGLQYIGGWLFSGSSDTPATGFTRIVTIDDAVPPDSNKKKITVTVSWSDASGANHQSRLTTYYTNPAVWQ